MISVIRSLTVLSLIWGAAGLLAAQDEFESRLAEQCQAVCQFAEAPWRTIPWQTDLLDAQKMAVEQHKPLFVWAMDGHPLGCT